jgi:hypothetical protein
MTRYHRIPGASRMTGKRQTIDGPEMQHLRLAMSMSARAIRQSGGHPGFRACADLR